MNNATYTCTAGYMLNETATRMCQSNGVWSGSEPTCPRELLYVPVYVSFIRTYPSAVDCGALTNPANGMVNVSTTTFMSTVTYTCNTGYMLNETLTRTCEAGSTWSGSEPSCDCELY